MYSKPKKKLTKLG